MYNDKAVFNLFTRVVESYFNKELRHINHNINYCDKEIDKAKKRLKAKLRPMDSEDLNFANSKILDVWADCCNNFEASKVRKLIRKSFNSQQDEYLLELEELQKYEQNV